MIYTSNLNSYCINIKYLSNFENFNHYVTQHITYYQYLR